MMIRNEVFQNGYNFNIAIHSDNHSASGECVLPSIPHLLSTAMLRELKQFILKDENQENYNFI